MPIWIELAIGCEKCPATTTARVQARSHRRTVTEKAVIYNQGKMLRMEPLALEDYYDADSLEFDNDSLIETRFPGEWQLSDPVLCPECKAQEPEEK